jgi:hypothetical protein
MRRNLASTALNLDISRPSEDAIRSADGNTDHLPEPQQMLIRRLATQRECLWAHCILQQRNYNGFGGMIDATVEAAGWS